MCELVIISLCVCEVVIISVCVCKLVIISLCVCDHVRIQIKYEIPSCIGSLTTVLNHLGL